MGKAPSPWLSLWLQAKNEPIGVVLRTNDPHRAKQQLYRARADAGMPELVNLQLRTSPFDEGQLVIVRGAGGGPKALEAKL